jgi:3'-phosphoadenosine 5'-phosphosulfate sulfotransferase (PAPS reductase)/FAD synthetase
MVGYVWQTGLPHNVGLVLDDGTCRGYHYGVGTHRRCGCYDTTKHMESAHEQRIIRFMELKKNEQLKLERTEAMAVAKEQRLETRRKEVEKEGQKTNG